MTQIIAFVGFKQVGKSTAAKYLEDKYGFVSHNFKDALVAEIKEKFPDLLREIMVQELENRTLVKSYPDDLFIHKPPLMRALMMNYGTEVRRGDNDGYWANQWEGKLVFGLENGTDVVTDDVRFINEADAVRKQGGAVIRLTRPDITSGGDHQSETEQLQIEADYTIECEQGNLEKLYTELDKIVS